MSRQGNVSLLLGIMCIFVFLMVEGQLQVGFYDNTCPYAEHIVSYYVSQGYRYNKGVAPGLLRMHFHDCFVRGCEGSVLLNSTSTNTAERDSIPNNSLRGFEVINNAKARLEEVCPGVVSCADILAFAARDSVWQTGWIYYEVPAGRRDGFVSLASEALSDLPPPTFDVNQLTQAFAAKGLNQTEMVALSGAHTIGRSQCASFTNRLYNFNSTFNTDPTLHPTYANQLKQKCPQNSIDPNVVVPLDPPSPNVFDTSYYSNILNNRGLLTSDQTLNSIPATANLVQMFANNDPSAVPLFKSAMIKMGKIGVLTGTSGEIRTNCRFVN